MQDKAKQAGAGPDKGEEESSHNLTIWLSIYVSTPFSPFLSCPLSSMCCSFVHVMQSQGCDWNDARWNKNERKLTVSAKYYNRVATVFHILCFSSQSPSSPMPPLVIFPMSKSQLVVTQM